MCIAARVCVPQPHNINRLILKNDNNAVLITMCAFLGEYFCQPISLSSSLCTAKIKRGKGGVSWHIRKLFISTIHLAANLPAKLPHKDAADLNRYAMYFGKENDAYVSNYVQTHVTISLSCVALVWLLGEQECQTTKKLSLLIFLWKSLLE